MNKENELNLSPKGSFDDLVASLREELGFSVIAHEDVKRQIATEIASKAKDGDVIGLGSGSTSFLATVALARRVSLLSMRVKVIPTSHEIAHLACALNLPIGEIGEAKIDWCFDGADEVDPSGNLLKGRGGALLREKVVIYNAKKAYILVDPSKLVNHLGERFPVPVEVLPEAVNAIRRPIRALGATEITLRKAGTSKDGPVITEHGNLILDVHFGAIDARTESYLKLIPGVVESGIFSNLNNVEIVGLPKGALLEATPSF